jgi:hypothetical protein
VETTPGGYWEDLATDLNDPEFAEAYVEEGERVAEVDAATNSAMDGRRTWPPAFFAAAPGDGRSVAEEADELLREDFGR